VKKIDVMMIQKNKFSSTEDSVNSISIGNSDLDDCTRSSGCKEFPKDSNSEVPEIDVVFVHGLRGGPYKTWRIAEDKHSTKSGLVEKIDEEAGKLGTFWPGQWLSADFNRARLFTLKYKVCFNFDTSIKKCLIQKNGFHLFKPLNWVFPLSQASSMSNSCLNVNADKSYTVVRS
jgi:hypothetical protein